MHSSQKLTTVVLRHFARGTRIAIRCSRTCSPRGDALWSGKSRGLPSGEMARRVCISSRRCWRGCGTGSSDFDTGLPWWRRSLSEVCRPCMLMTGALPGLGSRNSSDARATPFGYNTMMVFIMRFAGMGWNGRYEADVHDAACWKCLLHGKSNDCIDLSRTPGTRDPHDNIIKRPLPSNHTLPHNVIHPKRSYCAIPMNGFSRSCHSAAVLMQISFEKSAHYLPYRPHR